MHKQMSNESLVNELISVVQDLNWNHYQSSANKHVNNRFLELMKQQNDLKDEIVWRLNGEKDGG